MMLNLFWIHTKIKIETETKNNAPGIDAKNTLHDNVFELNKINSKIPFNVGKVKLPKPKIHIVNIANHFGAPASINFLTKG